MAKLKTTSMVKTKMGQSTLDSLFLRLLVRSSELATYHQSIRLELDSTILLTIPPSLIVDR